MKDSGFGEVPHGDKMLLSETDPKSCITEYTGVYETNTVPLGSRMERRAPWSTH